MIKNLMRLCFVLVLIVVVPAKASCDYVQERYFLALHVYSSCALSDSHNDTLSYEVSSKMEAISKLASGEYLGHKAGGCIDYLKSAEFKTVNLKTNEINTQQLNDKEIYVGYYRNNDDSAVAK